MNSKSLTFVCNNCVCTLSCLSIDGPSHLVSHIVVRKFVYLNTEMIENDMRMNLWNLVGLCK